MHEPYVAVIVAVEGDAVGKRWRYQSGVPIGRHPVNQLAFPDDEGLEPFHTGIVLGRSGWFCLNSNPDAPTFVDGEQIVAKYTRIPSGSIVRCGRQAFRVLYQEPGETYEESLLAQVEAEMQAEGRNKVRVAFAALAKTLHVTDGPA